MNEVVLVLERSPNTDKRYDHRLLATSDSEKLQKEADEAKSDGYSLAGRLVILEKETRSK